METIKPGKYVSLGYKLYKVGKDGKETLMHETDKNDPEQIIFGVTEYVIEGLERQIEGLKAGDHFDLRLTPSQAFGQHDPEKVLTLNKAIFVDDEGEFDAEMVKVGAYVPMMTQEGFHVNGLVKEITADSVVMDFNHPLAGCDVRFDGEIYTVRDATEEELHPVHQCCCGHDHGDNCGHDHGCEHDNGANGGCCGDHGDGCCKH